MDRFWSKVDRSGGPHECWPWIAARTEKGYGRFAVDWRAGKWELAHRTSYRLSVGSIPAGAFILHSCDNPPCCNPAHLRAGDHSANMRDAYDRGGRDRRLITRVVLDYAKGERIGVSKLTTAKVREIRRRFAEGESQGQLGKAFDVNQTTISLIVRGKTWRHV